MSKLFEQLQKLAKRDGTVYLQINEDDTAIVLYTHKNIRTGTVVTETNNEAELISKLSQYLVSEKQPA